MDYIEPGENYYARFWMGFVIPLFYFVGSYYTYDVALPYLFFDEYLGLSTSTFVL